MPRVHLGESEMGLLLPKVRELLKPVMQLELLWLLELLRVRESHPIKIKTKSTECQDVAKLARGRREKRFSRSDGETRRDGRSRRGSSSSHCSLSRRSRSHARNHSATILLDSVPLAWDVPMHFLLVLRFLRGIRERFVTTRKIAGQWLVASAKRQMQLETNGVLARWLNSLDAHVPYEITWLVGPVDAVNGWTIVRPK